MWEKIKHFAELCKHTYFCESSPVTHGLTVGLGIEGQHDAHVHQPCEAGRDTVALGTQVVTHIWGPWSILWHGFCLCVCWFLVFCYILKYWFTSLTLHTYYIHVCDCD